MAKKIEMLNDQQEVVHPLTSSDCVIMENGKTLEEVMGDGIATPTVTHEGASFQVGVGDSNIEVVDGDVAGMTLEGQTYQNILPKPTTLIMETDEKEFKINDKIDNNIVLDDNVAEIATIKGQTYVNAVQEESASEYVAIDEELNGQSITTTGKPEGYVKNAILEGLTLVNTIQEPSSADATVLELDADIDAQYATIDNTVQGGIHGVALKGQTLVNIHKSATYSLSRQNEGWYENLVAETNRISFEVTDTSTDGWRYLNLGKLNLDMLKPNTKYLVYFGVANFPHNLGVRFMNGNATDKISNEAMVAQGSNWAILTTSSEIIKSEQVLYVSFTNVLGKVEVGNAMIIEYQQGMENWDISYFEGMQSVEVPSVKTTGKNLLDPQTFIPFDKEEEYVRYEDGYVVANFTKVTTHFFYKIDLTKLPKGMYTVIAEHEGQDSYLGTQFVFKDGTKTWGKTQFDNDGSYAELGLYMQSTTNDPSLKVKVKVMLIVGKDTSAPYEPYKSNILSTPEEVVLRSLPNGVCDTLNLTTGEYVQRIGEINLSTSSSATWWQSGYTNDALLSVGSGSFTSLKASSFLVCNVLPSQKEQYNVLYNIDFDSEKNLRINVPKTIANDVSGFMSWLKSNNVIIVGELETPVVKTVDLSIVDQDNNPIKSIQTHPTLTHVSTSSQGLIPNIVIPSQLKYPTIIKPSTTYTVQLKQTTINSDNPLTINLGGTTMAVPSAKFTITTPSELTSQDVIFTGKNNVIGEVVITEGDTTGIKYNFFEGMNDVKSPSMYATGKNLVDYKNYNLNANVGQNPQEIIIGENQLSFNVNKASWISLWYDLYVESGKTYKLTYNTNFLKCFIFKSKVSTYVGSELIASATVTNATEGKIQKVEKTFTAPSTGFIRMRLTSEQKVGNHILQNIQLEEGSTATSYEPYKGVTIEQDIDSIPLTSDMFEQGGFKNENNVKGMSLQQYPLNVTTTRLRAKTLIKVKPNTRYLLKNKPDTFYRGWCLTFDKNGNYTGLNINNLTDFTTNYDVYYIAPVLNYEDNSDITPSSLDSLNLTLQEVPQEIVLRSLPNGVKDALNLTTGEYVQRIGEVVFDGSDDENWFIHEEEQDNYINKRFRTDYLRGKILYFDGGTICNIICDKVQCYPNLTWKDDREGIEHDSFYVSFRKNCETVTKFKQCLSQDPITIQYQLITPIITKVNLTNTTKLPSYNSTTHYDTIVPSNSLVPNIKIPSTVNYNVAIKPSTQYTIKANTTSAMNVDLGGSVGTLANGKVTLTTPSTLAHNSLKLGNGKAKEVMVIEGNEIKDNVPFFNGMKNVQMGGIKLVNIARYKSHANGVSANANKTVFTYTSVSSTASWGNIEFDKSLLKTNTVYTIYLNVVTNNSDRSNAIKISLGNDSDEWVDISNTFTGTFKTTFKTNDKKDEFFGIYFRNPSASGQQIVIQNPMIIEGDWTHLDEIPFIESEMIIEQPIIRSQGKNLFDGNEFAKRVMALSSSNNIDGNILTYNTTTTHEQRLIDGIFKPNTQYTIKLDVTFREPGKGFYVVWKYKDGTNNSAQGNSTQSGQTISFTLRSQANKTIDYFYTSYGQSTTVSIDLTKIQLEEGTSATSYEPFKHQTLYSNRVIGYEEDCYYAHGGGAKVPTDTINSVMADVEGLSVAYVTGGSSNYTFWDKDDAFISGKQYLDTSLSSYDKNGFIQVPSNAKYLRFAAGNDKNAQNLYGIATVTGELPLRSLPNGVCDTLNLVTGEYVQRVGEVVLDGSSDENWIDTSRTNNNKYRFGILGFTKGGENDVVATNISCDSYIIRTAEETYRENHGMSVDVNGALFIYDKMYGSLSLNAYKQHLSQNPITVQYELKTPIVRKIGLTAKGNYKEVKLNGSENWTSLESSSITTVKTYFAQYLINDKNTLNRFINIFNNKDFPTRSAEYLWTNDVEGMSYNVNGYIQIRVAKDKLDIQNIDGFKRWLSQHPIKIGYVSNTQPATIYSNILKPIFFNNINVQFMNNNVDIQPTLTLQSRSRNSYVMDMMKANTRYTLKALKNANSFTIDGTSYGAGTNGTFTSPSTLTNKLMITGQDVQELMIIEGDVTGKQLPYYKGIRSSFDNTDEIDIYSSNKNLFDMSKVEPYDETGINWWNTIIKENEVVSVRSGNVQSGQFGAYTTLNIKPNSVYTLYIEMEKDGEPFNGQIYVYENDKVWGNAKYAIYANTPYHINTSQNAKYITIGFNYGRDFPIGTTLVYKNMRLYLGKENPVYIPHQHNTTSFPIPTRLETVEVVKVDMLKDMELGAINPSGVNADSANRKRSIGYIPVQPNQKIVVNRSINIFMYDINKNFIKYKAGSDNTFAPDNCYFIRFYCDIANTNNITITKQQYKPIALNSLPNGIKDEIVIEPVSNKTKLIQRVGKVVLDGSESWVLNAYHKNTTQFIVHNIIKAKNATRQEVVCDKLQSVTDFYTTVNDSVWIFDSKHLVIHNSSSTSNQLKDWLKQNPLTVYYELDAPIIHEIRLTGFPFVYEDGSVQLNTELPHKTLVDYNVNQEQLINNQNETIIRHDKQIDNLYDYIELYLEEEYRMELFRMQLELSL